MTRSLRIAVYCVAVPFGLVLALFFLSLLSHFGDALDLTVLCTLLWALIFLLGMVSVGVGAVALAVYAWKGLRDKSRPRRPVVVRTLFTAALMLAYFVVGFLLAGTLLRTVVFGPRQRHERRGRDPAARCRSVGIRGERRAAHCCRGASQPEESGRRYALGRRHPTVVRPGRGLGAGQMERIRREPGAVYPEVGAVHRALATPGGQDQQHHLAAAEASSLRSPMSCGGPSQIDPACSLLGSLPCRCLMGFDVQTG
jgi:hypothetical protein